MEHEGTISVGEFPESFGLTEEPSVGPGRSEFENEKGTNIMTIDNIPRKAIVSFMRNILPKLFFKD